MRVSAMAGMDRAEAVSRARVSEVKRTMACVRLACASVCVPLSLCVCGVCVWCALCVVDDQVCGGCSRCM